MDYAHARQILIDTVRPASEPLGLALIPSQAPWPRGLLRPANRGLTCTMCQWTNLARRQGVPVGLKAEDIACAPCQVALGLQVLDEHDALVQFFQDMGYLQSAALGAAMLEGLPVLPAGAYQGVAAFPLHRAPLEPDVVWIYGMPSQISHLVIGLINQTGTPVPSQTGLGGTCRLGLMDQTQILIPGRGERLMAGTEQSELFLALPATRLEVLIRGLEAVREQGITGPLAGQPGQAPSLPAMATLAARLRSP